jgi:hypothetical protein
MEISWFSTMAGLYSKAVCRGNHGSSELIVVNVSFRESKRSEAYQGHVAKARSKSARGNAVTG